MRDWEFSRLGHVKGPQSFLAKGRQVLLVVFAITCFLGDSRGSSIFAEAYGDGSAPISMGTTILALKYKGGVIVGADSRTSVSGYVSNKFARKINILVEAAETSCVVCRSGSAADTQWLAIQAKAEFQSRSMRYGLVPSVSQVAHFLRYQVRSASSELQASLICAGYDRASREGHIYNIAKGGSLLEEEVYSVSGSGSTYIIGHIDHELAKSSRSNLSLNEDEAIDMVTRLIRLSIKRDGGSGGLIRLVIMNEDGLREVTIYPEQPSPADDTGSVSSAAKLEGFAPPIKRSAAITVGGKTR